MARPPRQPALTLEKATAALTKHNGIISYAAKACGVSRMTFYKFMDKHPELEEIRQQADEELLDVGEAHIVQAVHGGDMKTIRWHLERKGKNRGYTTRQEQTGADGGPMQFESSEPEVVDPDE